MRFARYFSALLTTAVLALGTLTGCGSLGNPLPPSLELPRPVSDLKAARKGDKVLLTWTAPRETTDKLRIKEAGTTRVCRATAPPAAMECSQIGEVPGPAAPVAETFIDYLPHDLQERTPTRFAVYTVEAMNTRGRSAGLSNPVPVPLVPTLPPPDKLLAQVTAEGPVISWVVPADERGQSPLLPEATKARQPVAYSYRLYRRERNRPTAPAVVVPLENAFASPTLAQPNLNVRDTGTEWEKVYVYWVTVVTRVTAEDQATEVEGEDSPPAEVWVHDVFPPAAPKEVQAVATSGGGQSFIDLTWNPNSEADLAGYNVYRREGDAQPQKINGELLKTPAFRDPNVAAGHTYLYSVSAVDLRGNESGRSEETSESVPQP